MSDEETNRSQELKDMFVTLPAHRFMYKNVEHLYEGLVREKVERPYISSKETCMSIEQIKEFLTRSGILDKCLEGL